MTRDEFDQLCAEVMTVLDERHVDDRIRSEVAEVFTAQRECEDFSDEDEDEDDDEPNATQLLFAALTTHGHVSDVRVLPRETQERILKDLWSLARYTS
jgi:hypothetical protein